MLATASSDDGDIAFLLCGHSFSVRLSDFVANLLEVSRLEVASEGDKVLFLLDLHCSLDNPLAGLLQLK